MMIKAFLEIKYSDISYKVTLSGAVTQYIEQRAHDQVLLSAFTSIQLGFVVPSLTARE